MLVEVSAQYWLKLGTDDSRGREKKNEWQEIVCSFVIMFSLTYETVKSYIWRGLACDRRKKCVCFLPSTALPAVCCEERRDEEVLCSGNSCLFWLAFDSHRCCCIQWNRKREQEREQHSDLIASFALIGSEVPPAISFMNFSCSPGGGLPRPPSLVPAAASATSQVTLAPQAAIHSGGKIGKGARSHLLGQQHITCNCGSVFPNLELLDRHMIAVHPENTNLVRLLEERILNEPNNPLYLQSAVLHMCETVSQPNETTKAHGKPRRRSGSEEVQMPTMWEGI